MKKESQPLSVPLEVHPGIKLCRWVFLIVGVLHGAERLKRLKIYDAPLREQAKIADENRRVRLAREKAIMARAEMAGVALLFVDPDPRDPIDLQDPEDRDIKD